MVVLSYDLITGRTILFYLASLCPTITILHSSFFYKPFTSIFNSVAKLDRDLPSFSQDKSCNHTTNDGRIDIP